MRLSIIIPVFNEEKTIRAVLERVADVAIPGVEKEVIVVDDGSTDATASIVSNGKLPISNFKFIKQKTNQGKGAAVRTGIEQATGEYIVIQDADLEYNPKDIPRLLEPILEKKADVVFGTRLKRLPHLNKEESHHLFLLHYFGNRFLSLVTSVLFGVWITDMETCYKLFPRKALDGVVLHAKSFEFEPEITAKLLKKGYRIRELPITTTPRGYEEGKKLHALHDGRIAIWTLVKYRFTN